MGKAEQKPSFLTSILGLFIVFMWYICGKIRDMINPSALKTRKGYAPLRAKMEDFFNRRFYARMHDCWNRPIGSSPGAWIDVLKRTDLNYTSGFHAGLKLELTGETHRCLNLGSYNYLGFAARDVYCTPRVIDTLQDWGVSSCSTRVESGTTKIHQEMEDIVADFVGKEAALVYGMGFATNSITIPALVGKGCLILSDSLNHASIAFGAKVSGAKVKVFRHNDAKHLELLLRESIAGGQPRINRPWKKIMIIVEGIYSMEGEVCNLKEIVEVKKKYKAYLYLDEAHSIGAMGRTGRGVAEHAGVNPKDIDIMMGTFTKSFGSCGGYIAGDRGLIHYLKRHSPGHVYAQAITPAGSQQVISAFKLLKGEDGTNRGLQKVQQLHDNANFVRQKLIDMGLHVLGDHDSPVIPVMIYHIGRMPLFSRMCLERHVATVVVSFPATPLLLARARICISAAHSREEMEYALEVFSSVADQTLLKYNKPKPQPILEAKKAFKSSKGWHPLRGLPSAAVKRSPHVASH